MARVNFREIQNRFSHIDGTFVDCSLTLPANEPYFRVEFYAMWEHPLYLEARKNGTSWGFTGLEGAERVMTIYPIGLRRFDVSLEIDATDIGFIENDPMVWEFEPEGEIFCNAKLSLAEVPQMAGHISQMLRCDWQDIASLTESFGRIFRYGSASCFNLGRFPYTVFWAVRAYLERHSIPCYVSWEPQRIPGPVLFVCGDAKIVADDFEVDVPEFEHRAEWFKPYVSE